MHADADVDRMRAVFLRGGLGCRGDGDGAFDGGVCRTEGDVEGIAFRLDLRAMVPHDLRPHQRAVTGEELGSCHVAVALDICGVPAEIGE